MIINVYTYRYICICYFQRYENCRSVVGCFRSVSIILENCCVARGVKSNLGGKYDVVRDT